MHSWYLRTGWEHQCNFCSGTADLLAAAIADSHSIYQLNPRATNLVQSLLVTACSAARSCVVHLQPVPALCLAQQLPLVTIEPSCISTIGLGRVPTMRLLLPACRCTARAASGRCGWASSRQWRVPSPQTLSSGSPGSTPCAGSPLNPVYQGIS